MFIIDRDHYAASAVYDRMQNEILTHAIIANLQGQISEPEAFLAGLRFDARGGLNANNRFARRYLGRALGGLLCDRVGAEPPHWIPEVSVFWVTIADTAFTLRAAKDRTLVHDSQVVDAVDGYKQVVAGLNFLGMVEGGLYVYLPEALGYGHAINWHAHGWVWGASEDQMQAWAQHYRSWFRAFVPGATSIDYAPIDQRGLLGTITYAMKMPGAQHQLQKLEGHRYTPIAGKTNGVNAVFLSSAFRGATLDQLIVASGEGKRLVRRALRRKVRQLG